MVVVLQQVAHEMIMISGNSDIGVILRKATAQDLSDIKALADLHRRELGFVIRGALESSITSAEIIVATDEDSRLLGFVHYRHRRDQQTTLYNIVVDEEHQRLGLGTKLIDALRSETEKRRQKHILLKCPQKLPANEFYRGYGFVLSDNERGKVKPLNIWKLDL